ncbi:GGDEF domain-containing protein [Blastococcus capsensis]|uniref:GGDEF domain-containing protein n=1 Tax=Blastococcus capsensis TaxID=1564163 RepID=UPI0025412787|nr:GGDEF domain-containing protein [Blastococcus capsensis]MDK3256580.1 GGDEF domain-containing protein [Blastococcus capsensis]
MIRSRAPEVATTRVMAQTLATFYAFGGVAGLFITAGAEPGAGRWILLCLSLVALAGSAVAARRAARWPRPAFHVAVIAATVLITIAVLVSPDPVTALAAATLTAFVVVDAHLFFSGRQALAHLVVAVSSTTVALLVTGGVALTTALGLDLVLVALGVVTRRLVMRASTASRDALTGLCNRRGFDDALQELMAEAHRTGEPLSAVLLDLDRFKAVNDTAGHEAGDRMLCRVADAWRRELPASAVLARHGGDEFSLLLPRTTGEAALALVRRICAAHPDIPMSCGVAEHHPRESASQLMRRADRGLYEAKAAGRGRAELDDSAPSGLRTHAVPDRTAARTA